jgi:phage I-like protein
MAKASISLKCFKATLNGVSDKGELPSRLKLFDWGTNKTNQGNFIVDDRTFACFAENQDKMMRQTVQVDFNHNTVDGTPAFMAAKGSPEIAGYGVPVCIRGKGIFLEGIDTTPSGMEKAADYRDLSPAPLATDDGLVVGLHSVALVPAGSTEGLTLEGAALKALSSSLNLKTLSVPDSSFGGPKAKPNAYKNGEDQNNVAMEKDLMKQISTMLDMPEDASYEDVCERLKAVYHRMDGKKGPLDSPRPGTEIVTHTLTAKDLADAVGAAIKPLEATVNKLQSDLDTRAAQMEETERNTVVAEATKCGKVIPLNADEIKSMPLAILKSLCANLKKDQVPVEARVKPLSALADRTKLTRADSARLIEEQISAQRGN